MEKILDLTKPVAEQSDEELAATLRMQSGWQVLREVGEGGRIRLAMDEAARRIASSTPPKDEQAREIERLTMERDSARELLVIGAKRQEADHQHIRKIEGELRALLTSIGEGLERQVIERAAKTVWCWLVEHTDLSTDQIAACEAAILAGEHLSSPPSEQEIENDDQ